MKGLDLLAEWCTIRFQCVKSHLFVKHHHTKVLDRECHVAAGSNLRDYSPKMRFNSYSLI